MAISFNKYIDIQSFFGSAQVIPLREYIGRIFTTNNLLSPNALLEITKASDAATFFGSDSEEYARAVFYFSFISKRFSSPQKLSYARYVPVAVAPRIYGIKITAVLNTFQAIADGSFSLTIGSVTNVISGLDFTAAASFSDVASIIQTEIRTKTGVQWTAATVAYDNTKTALNFVGGDAVDATISTATGGVGTDIRTLMGWGNTANFTEGSAIKTPVETLQASVDASTNFGSFLFMPALSSTDAATVATWNQTENVKYMYMQQVLPADIDEYVDALTGIEGTGITNAPIVTEFPEMLPMSAFATTNYDGIDTTLNYMFQSAALTPSVSDDTTSDAYDFQNVNYYGVTQQAGTLLAFYQRGYLTASDSDNLTRIDMGVFANEIWFKDASGVAFMSLLINSNKVPANQQGRAMLLAIQQPVINQALINGTISVGKFLTDADKAKITEITQDPDAWLKVQNVGSWVDWVITPITQQGGNGPYVEYQAQYTFIYSKNDTIRSVKGTHILF
jgi:hypothetical protein